MVKAKVEVGDNLASLPFALKIVFWYYMVVASVLFIMGIIGGLITPLIAFILMIFATIVGILAYNLKKRKKYAYWIILIISILGAIYALTRLFTGEVLALAGLIIDLGIIYCLIRKEVRVIYLV